MRVLFVASECFPLIKTGGLADVVGALPRALNAQGVDVTVFLPGFPPVLKGLKKKKVIGKTFALGSGTAKLMEGETDSGLKIIALDAPELFKFEGNPYQNPDGTDRDGNGLRYAAFSRVAADLAIGRYGVSAFDVVHAHDWQAGLVSAYLSTEMAPVPASVLTLHNLAFQGLFPKMLMPDIGLPADYFAKDNLEYWDKISFLKAGIVHSHHVTTVSPSYALEIQTNEGGMGFGGLLRSRGNALSGILNGIDTEVWNPETDPDIAANFSRTKLSAKAKNKAQLQKDMGLKVSKNTPLFAVISRLTGQKGLDLLADAVPQITALGGQLMVLGSGDSAIESQFLASAKANPDSVACFIGYDEPLAHRVQAAADAIMIPSRFEPCGLTQLCAMRYGTIPVVGRVGGLNDTVIDANPAALAKNCATGVQFSPIDPHMLASAINRTFELYAAPKTWRGMAQNCMAQDVSWKKSAQQYANLYARLKG
ncbi:glycogen synthase GlgA [Litorimonas sp. RW-G-Af-16]|uniref:glycogen synthase GlgA n=1 Tax=Litorimonas sp. RW-G-Af-16 TaxID=3241168 RepID=UPI00390CD480